MIVAFRSQTLMPLDDSLFAPQPIIPRLTRPALHRDLQNYDISQLSDA